MGKGGSAFLWDILRNFIKGTYVRFSWTIEVEIPWCWQKGLQGPQMLDGEDFAGKEHQA